MRRKSREIRELGKWFRSKAKPFLLQEMPDRVLELEKELEFIEHREKTINDPLTVCFVGGAGVGKSTLINAMVAGGETVVPSGGVGPLTAQAIEITISDSPRFTAIYHSPAKIWQICFAIENAIKRETQIAVMESDDKDLAGLLDQEDLNPVSENGETTEESRTETLRKQAQLLIAGHQDKSLHLTYIADSIREVIGKERKWGTQCASEDRTRVNRLKRIFKTDDKKSESIHESDASKPDFNQELFAHAAGYLSPIIKELSVGWTSDLLKQGIQLVDLPGLGIEGDVYRDVSSKWVRNNAKAIVLVVGHRGITEPDAQLLRVSGFLTRLLHSIDDPAADPVSLIVAVVRADEIANTRRDVNKDKSKVDHLLDVRRECEDLVKRQLKECLSKVWGATDADTLTGKREVIDRLADSLIVSSLSTTEYRRFLINDEDDRPFIKSAEQSGVPEIVQRIKELASSNRDSVMDRFDEAVVSFRTRLTTQIEAIKARWEESSRAVEEAEQLRAELDSFIKPLREEFRARQGGFRTFLKETLPSTIDKVVSDASLAAHRSIDKYLQGLESANWRTLQAAVRREGTYHGARYINLPNDYASSYEDPIAESWGKSILSELRKKTREFSEDCLGFVDQMIQWAKEQGGRVQPRLIETQRDAIAADTKHLATIGKNAVDELRATVRRELCEAIREPIGKKCREFVERNQHTGTGVHRRIIYLFKDLADDAIDAARKPATRVLLDNYDSVYKEIVEAWKNHNDPLETVADALVASHKDSVKRSDAQKRKAVLESIDDLFTSMPS